MLNSDPLMAEVQGLRLLMDDEASSFLPLVSRSLDLLNRILAIMGRLLETILWDALLGRVAELLME